MRTWDTFWSVVETVVVSVAVVIPPGYFVRSTDLPSSLPKWGNFGHWISYVDFPIEGSALASSKGNAPDHPFISISLPDVVKGDVILFVVDLSKASFYRLFYCVSCSCVILLYQSSRLSRKTLHFSS